MKRDFSNCVVVITGATSGVGLATSNFFAEKGCKVFGLARNIDKKQSATLIACDVTKKEDVKRAISQIFEKTGRIDLLINNAGFGISGSIENCNLADAKRMFDVNFFGAVNATQEVLPIMRSQGFGRIINTSSVASLVPIPFQSFYSATKASLDIWAKALRLEVAPFGIQVANVLLGDTKTGFTKHREKNSLQNEGVYASVVERSVAKMERDEQNGKDPKTAAQAMFNLFLKKKMPATKTVGGGYKTLVFLTKIMPQKFMLWVVKKLYC